MAERTPIVPTVRATRLGKLASFKPFPDSFIGISAVAEAECPLMMQAADYCVNWPSIGSTDTTRAREFALAILDACDWVDAQRKGEAVNG